MIPVNDNVGVVTSLVSSSLVVADDAIDCVSAIVSIGPIDSIDTVDPIDSVGLVVAIDAIDTSMTFAFSIRFVDSELLGHTQH